MTGLHHQPAPAEEGDWLSCCSLGAIVIMFLIVESLNWLFRKSEKILRGSIIVLSLLPF